MFSTKTIIDHVQGRSFQKRYYIYRTYNMKTNVEPETYYRMGFASF